MLRQGGEAAIQQLRDNARAIADQLGLPEEFQYRNANQFPVVCGLASILRALDLPMATHVS
jgi:hypothetical protein